MDHFLFVLTERIANKDPPDFRTCLDSDDELATIEEDPDEGEVSEFSTPVLNPLSPVLALPAEDQEITEHILLSGSPGSSRGPLRKLSAVLPNFPIFSALMGANSRRGSRDMQQNSPSKQPEDPSTFAVEPQKEETKASSYPDISLESPIQVRPRVASDSSKSVASVSKRRVSRFSIRPDDYQISSVVVAKAANSSKDDTNGPENNLQQMFEMIDGLSLENLRQFAKNQALQVEQYQLKIFAGQDGRAFSLDSVSNLTTMAGWMYKKGQILRKWVRRFVTLRGSFLNFHDGPKMPVKSFINLEISTSELITKRGYDDIAHIDNHPISIEALKALKTPFENTCFLQTVSICRANMDDTCMETFCDAIEKNDSISMLKFDNNQVGNIGATAMSETVENKMSIVSLSLKKNNISDEGFVSLMMSSLKNSSMVEIDLSGNKITSSGFKALFESLSNRHDSYNLYKLSISENKIGSEGLKWLIKILETNKCKITDLDLSATDIDNEGALELSNFLPTSKVITLNLSSNKITRIGSRHLARAFRASATLLNIDLSGNDIFSDDLRWVNNSGREEGAPDVEREIFHGISDSDLDYVMRVNRLKLTKEYVHMPTKILSTSPK